MSGSNYLFFLPGPKVWMVGPEPGKDYGGILNREGGLCPEDLSRDWEYYSDLMDSWEEDWTMEATCSVCNGGDSCCNGNCGEGEGDCDWDMGCAGDLVCGVDNCPQGGTFDSTDD